jgi:hypothetical protein
MVSAAKRNPLPDQRASNDQKAIAMVAALLAKKRRTGEAATASFLRI